MRGEAGGCLLLSVLLGHHYTLQVRSVDHSSVDLELGEGVINLVAGELLAPGHQRMSEPVTAKVLIIVFLQVEYTDIVLKEYFCRYLISTRHPIIFQWLGKLDIT